MEAVPLETSGSLPRDTDLCGRPQATGELGSWDADVALPPGDSLDLWRAKRP